MAFQQNIISALGSIANLAEFNKLRTGITTNTKNIKEQKVDVGDLNKEVYKTNEFINNNTLKQSFDLQKALADDAAFRQKQEARYRSASATLTAAKEYLKNIDDFKKGSPYEPELEDFLEDNDEKGGLK